MSIRICGVQSGREYEAACDVKTAWEQILRPTDDLTILVGARCYGERVQETDLILLGTFGSGLDITKYVRDNRGESVHLINLCLVVEVKDHTDHLVSFNGQQVIVEYRGGLKKDATVQVHEQMHSLINYLKRYHIPTPRIATSIWLPNYAGEVPMSAANVVRGALRGEDWVRLIERTSQLMEARYGSGYYISYTRNQSLREIVAFADHFVKPLKPGNIDRRRMEVICKRVIGEQRYADNMGKQLLMFRGRGGSGKTLHLLRIAKDLHDMGNRVLLLTFNRALVSDIRRLMMLIDIREETTDRGFRIETVVKYFTSVLEAFNMWKWSDYKGEFPSREYEDKKDEFLELLKDDSPESISRDKAFTSHGDTFAWDYILIDEAQDWPANERDLLFKLFGPDKCIVADGVDQLTRRNNSCDWTVSTSKSSRQLVALRKSMRMKSNLCRFVQQFAAELGVTWDQEISEEVIGGRVTIVFGKYTQQLHEEVLSDQRKDGNEPIDALYCVPSSSRGTLVHPFVGRLQEWNCEVWDGTIPENRGSYPLSVNEHRVVHYESCRGLEGWSVICIGIDKHFESKFENAPDPSPNTLFETPESNARRYAAQWTLIPLTRAIDHLILNITEEGEIMTVCKAIANRYPDFVTVVDSEFKASK